MNVNIPFLIVADEASVAESIRRTVSTVSPRSRVSVAEDGISGMELLLKHNYPVIVIADINMPGVSGLQMLKKARTTANISEAYFIMLTVRTDKETNMKAFQMEVDDFLYKPFAGEDLVGKIRVATRLINQKFETLEKVKEIHALEDELKLNTEKLKNLILKFQYLRLPESVAMFKRVQESAVWISMQFNEITAEEIEDIKTASELCYVGRLLLPDKYINESITINGLLRNETMGHVPAYANELLSQIRNYEKISAIVCHIYENYDGSGFPDKLQGWKIPLGSRILRVVLDYEENVTKQKMASTKAFEMLEHEEKRIYDHKIVTLLDQCFAETLIKLGRIRERAIDRRDLMPGMTLSRNIITESGLKIMGVGATLTPENIEKIFLITKSDPNIGSFFIYGK